MSETPLTLASPIARAGGKKVTDADAIETTDGRRVQTILDETKPLAAASAPGGESQTAPLTEAETIAAIALRIAQATLSLVTDQQLLDGLAGKADQSFVSGALSDKLATATFNERISDYITTSDAQALLGGAIDQNELNQSLTLYVSNVALSTQLGSYLTNATAAATYATKSQLEAAVANGSEYKGEVISRSTAAQPASPGQGDKYVLPASPTGAAWSTFAQHDLVEWTGSSWTRQAPANGWLVSIIGTGDANNGTLSVFSDDGWIQVPAADQQAILEELGLSTGAARIGLMDAAANYNSSDVEAALAEIPGKITTQVDALKDAASTSFDTLGKIQARVNERVLATTLGGTLSGQGAETVGLRTITGVSGSTVRAALVDMKDQLDAKEASGAAAAVQSALLGGVAAEGDTLAKNWAAISSAITGSVVNFSNFGELRARIEERLLASDLAASSGAGSVGNGAITGVSAGTVAEQLVGLASILGGKTDFSSVQGIFAATNNNQDGGDLDTFNPVGTTIWFGNQPNGTPGWSQGVMTTEKQFGPTGIRDIQVAKRFTLSGTTREMMAMRVVESATSRGPWRLVAVAESDGFLHTDYFRKAAQAEAEAGTDNAKLATPLSVKQALDDHLGNKSLSGQVTAQVGRRYGLVSAVTGVTLPATPADKSRVWFDILDSFENAPIDISSAGSDLIEGLAAFSVNSTHGSFFLLYTAGNGWSFGAEFQS